MKLVLLITLASVWFLVGLYFTIFYLKNLEKIGFRHICIAIGLLFFSFPVALIMLIGSHLFVILLAILFGDEEENEKLENQEV